MSVQQKPRQRLRGPERREALLDAALGCFTRAGYHGTHVSHIVQAAGVARGTFYLHFESKRHAFAALVERMLGIFLDVRPPGPEPELTGPDAQERLLRESYAALLSTFRQHARLCRLLFEEALGQDKGFASRLEEHFAAWHARVARTLERFVEAGLARRRLDVEVTAQLVLGMVERVVRRYLLGPDEPDLPRLVDALVAFEMGGVGPAPRR